MRIDDDCVVVLPTKVKTVLYIVGADQAATSITRQQQPSRKATAFLSILLGHIHNKHVSLNLDTRSWQAVIVLILSKGHLHSPGLKVTNALFSPSLCYIRDCKHPLITNASAGRLNYNARGASCLRI